MKLMLLLLMVATCAGCAPGPATLNNQGNELVAQERYDEAVLAYQRAQVQQPDAAVPYYNAAAAYLGRADLARARAALEQALRHANDNDGLVAQAAYNLGNVAFAQARYDEAVRAYQRVLLLRPDDEDARYNLELALRRLPTPTPDVLATATPSEGEPTPTPTQQDPPQSPDVPTATSTSTPEQATALPPDPGAAGQIMADETTSLLSVGEAERLLDAVQRNQQSLVAPNRRGIRGTLPLENDW